MPRHATKTSFKEGENHPSWSGGCSDYWRAKARILVNCPKGKVVHHIDGDYKNNKLENLKIMFQSEHVALHNKQRTGIKKKSLAREVAKDVIKLKQKNLSYKDISERLNINRRMVKRCLSPIWQKEECIYEN